jgi:hypothetical protein
MFLNCDVTAPYSSGGNYAFDVRGPNALYNCSIAGGGWAGIAWVRCPAGGGSMHVHALSSPSQGISDAVCVMESGHVMVLSGTRTEVRHMLRMENGIVICQALSCPQGASHVIEINGGRCLVEGSDLGNDIANENSGEMIIGTGGSLFIAGTAFNYPPPDHPLSGYSGTIAWDPEDWENYTAP